MSELERKIEELRSRNADLTEILERVEQESGWVPKDTPMPEFIRQLSRERDAAQAERDLVIEESAKRRARLEEERDAALKCCAEMKTELSYLLGELQMAADFGPLETLAQTPRDAIILDLFRRLPGFRALSTDCGKGYVSRDEVKPLVEALETIRDVACGEKQCKTEAMQALTHWRKEEE